MFGVVFVSSDEGLNAIASFVHGCIILDNLEVILFKREFFYFKTKVIISIKTTLYSIFTSLFIIQEIKVKLVIFQ